MKFSIRDLLLVTAIVAVCVAWWLDRGKLLREAATERARARLIALEQENKLLRMESAAALWKRAIDELPTSQAPAPNPPKD